MYKRKYPEMRRISVKTRYRAITIVIVPFGWLCSFLVILISSVIIVSYLAVSFLSGFIQFSVIIILRIIIIIVTITLVDHYILLQTSAGCLKILG
jgi:hypothetical protein